MDDKMVELLKKQKRKPRKLLEKNQEKHMQERRELLRLQKIEEGETAKLVDEEYGKELECLEEEERQLKTGREQSVARLTHGQERVKKITDQLLH